MGNNLSTLAVVLITLNEGHSLPRCLRNLRGFADEIYVLDSYSKDNTIDICIEFGVKTYQRSFDGFGNQWNFAISQLPIESEWVMKIDPDEILTDKLKLEIKSNLKTGNGDGFSVNRKLCFMGKELPIKQVITRIWRRGKCKFSNVVVNEHPIVDGVVSHINQDILHHDSPHLEHWIAKQNLYTTMEALQMVGKSSELSANPILLGSALERRMWFKKYFWRFPFKFSALFIYHYIILGSWRVGLVGLYWAQLRTFVYKLWYLKMFEINLCGVEYVKIATGVGIPDERAIQIEK